MSDKTRVEKYRKLREEIENIDTYSFEDPKRRPRSKRADQEPLIPIHDLAEEEETLQENHIKKNTLSLSIDELIKQHEAYTEALEREEIDKKIKDNKNRQHRFGGAVFQTRYVIWGLIGLILASIVVIVGLVIGGVI